MRCRARMAARMAAEVWQLRSARRTDDRAALVLQPHHVCERELHRREVWVGEALVPAPDPVDLVHAVERDERADEALDHVVEARAQPARRDDSGAHLGRVEVEHIARARTEVGGRDGVGVGLANDVVDDDVLVAHQLVVRLLRERVLARLPADTHPVGQFGALVVLGEMRHRQQEDVVDLDLVEQHELRAEAGGVLVLELDKYVVLRPMPRLHRLLATLLLCCVSGPLAL